MVSFHAISSTINSSHNKESPFSYDTKIMCVSCVSIKRFVKTFHARIHYYIRIYPQDIFMLLTYVKHKALTDYTLEIFPRCLS